MFVKVVGSIIDKNDNRKWLNCDEAFTKKGFVQMGVNTPCLVELGTSLVTKMQPTLIAM